MCVDDASPGGRAHPRPERRHCRTARRPAARRAWRGCHQGRAARGDIRTAALPGVSGLQPEQAVGDDRPRAARGPGGAARTVRPPTCWSRRAPRARWPGSGPDVRRPSAASSPGWSTARSRRGRRDALRRTGPVTKPSSTPAPASSGRTRRFRTGPVFLHSPVASFGAMFLVPIGIMSALHARERTGTRAARRGVPAAGCLSLTTQIWNWTDQGQFLLAEDAPARRAPGDDLRVRRRGVDPRLHAGRVSLRPGARRRSSGSRTSPTPHSCRWDRRSGPPTRSGNGAAFYTSASGRAGGGVPRGGSRRGADRGPPRAVLAPAAAGDRRGGRGAGSGGGERRPNSACPLYLEGTPGAVQGPQPSPGAHTEEILDVARA